MVALTEHELAAHNKPNLHVSMAFTHTAILTSTTFQIPSNSSYLHTSLQNLSISKNARWHPGTSSSRKLGSHLDDHWMTELSASVSFHSPYNTTFRCLDDWVVQPIHTPIKQCKQLQ